ncbi:MAG TPA: hypothetical protein VFX70_05345 [Mycobacteriales bacterium]|nr:hypothetical protein [Mycobacteriales bacterium]
MTDDYDLSQVLFRQAKARYWAARRFANEATEREVQGDSGERQQRERDAVITTLILTQASAECYANWVHIQARTSPGPRWVKRWERLPTAAEAMGRPANAELNETQCEFLNLLGAWRQALMHGDDTAWDRLRNKLIKSGALPSDTSVLDLLTVDLAESMVTRADELFRWAQDLTGIQAPFLDSAWVAADEY